jgi:hypothetical protein
MKMDGTRPQIGRGAALLGVRFGPNMDVNPDEQGLVGPGEGGMSVSPNPDTLPPHRLPRRLRAIFPTRFRDASGPNALHCWWMGEGPFVPDRIANGLRLRLDPDKPEQHGFVEPDVRMNADEYESALQATRDEWRKWEE